MREGGDNITEKYPSLSLTIISEVDGTIFSYEECLLQEAQNDDSKDPELESDQILEGAHHHHYPSNTIYGIDRCHDTIELSEGGR